MNMRDKFYVDIGVGDAIEQISLKWPSFIYKEKPWFEDPISLEEYPVETIFAEKLKTIISRGGANSRMKDYHDLFLSSLTQTNWRICSFFGPVIYVL